MDRTRKRKEIRKILHITRQPAQSASQARANARPGELKGLTEAGDPLAVVNVASPGLARAQDDQLGTAKIDAHNFKAREDSVVPVGRRVQKALGWCE